jgi:pimeloyl-ACP methyl ester carboxylesterase
MVNEAALQTSSWAPSALDMGEEKWINVDGIRTRYFDQGEGERIVFIHGVQMGSTDGSSSARTWDLNFAALSSSFNTISLDRLGQGYTDNPKSDNDYTMHASVQHVIAFLDRLGKKPYHLVGHSRGGYMVARITMERPDLVKTITCVSSGTLAPGAPRTEAATRNRPQPEHQRESIRWYLERYSYNPMIVTDAWLDDSQRIANLEKTQFAVSRMRASGLLKDQFAPKLYAQRAETHQWLLTKGMACPTLIAWGRNDPGAHLEAGLRLIEMFMSLQPKTEWRLFNRCGHFVFREHPAAFNRMLHDFVRENC